MTLILGTLLDLLNAKATVPSPFGFFHIISLLATVGAALLLYRIAPKGTEKQIRTIMLIVSLLNIVLEIYKQINFTFLYNGTTIDVRYEWHIFPFQLCSTPMYIGLIAAFSKGRLHRACCDFLATYGIFGGACVMLFPNEVFVDTIGINIQSMVCHGSMIAIGAYLFLSGYVKTEWKTILRAFCVFSVLVCIAVLLNEAAHQLGITEHDLFNMFFISPYYRTTLPVYTIAQDLLPFPWCIPAYMLVVTSAATAAMLLLSVVMFIKRRFVCLKKDG